MGRLAEGGVVEGSRGGGMVAGGMKLVVVGGTKEAGLKGGMEEEMVVGKGGRVEERGGMEVFVGKEGGRGLKGGKVVEEGGREEGGWEDGGREEGKEAGMVNCPCFNFSRNWSVDIGSGKAGTPDNRKTLAKSKILIINNININK